MRQNLSRASTGRLLEIGFALALLAAPAAFAAPAQTVGKTSGGPGQGPLLYLAQAQGGDPTLGGPDQTPQQPQPAAPMPSDVPTPSHGTVILESGSGKVLTLTLPAANIYVADPKVAEVRPASSTSLFVFGVSSGHTTIAAVDLLGRLLGDFDVTVKPSGFGAREAQEAITRLIPGSQIHVAAQGKGLILTGAVANAADAQQAMTIAKGFAVGEATTVNNQMTIAAPSQVTLMVRMAEMKRSIARNLGISWSAQGFFGTMAPLFGVPSAATHLLQLSYNGDTCATARVCLDGVLNALATDGLAHILAEPNLTVMSGQPASFQAGGEYPYAVYGGSANPNSVTVEFKPYGVLVSFVPTVLSGGRINLHVKPEVSQLDSTNTVALPGGTSVQGLLVRRAETTVELGSGETFAIAGMLQTMDNDNGTGLPGLGDAPIIGALFKTNNLTREQTELVIIVTPILVRPVANMAQLRLPGEGYKPQNDVGRLLLNHQVANRDGSTTTAVPAASQAGFLVR